MTWYWFAPWIEADKADIIWRYISAHADKLEQEGHLEGLNRSKSQYIILLYPATDPHKS